MHELCLGDEVVFADILKWKVNRAASGIIHVLCPTISRQLVQLLDCFKAFQSNILIDFDLYSLHKIV